ncbi:protein phosphatase 1 regulatory subunit 12A isoform X2 [Anarrhichthys ocellatus]|uniref:protein phosphatase 1 regulatory subunit 12A isoform X2 n=1 Tax=Anarrhichthys ocellatus TaxID=433405 RepID=UPI0012ED2C88|nr:protein phosphatase 1 regulatory subunit 12A-like isoform X2 [Anarrhichthys ocellatus]
MQAFVPRSYLTPVRDEEAESQRKAKCRHARQTRRSTQGVTLTDLKEAQKTNSLSPQDKQMEEGGTLAERSCLKKGLTDDRRVKIGSTETTETMEISPKLSKMDEQGNIEPRLESLAESPIPDISYSCIAGSRGLFHCNNSFIAGEGRWRDENQNPVEDEAPLTFATTRRHCWDGEHDRLSRYDSSGESATDKPLGRASSYTRRETRLAALSRQDQDSTTKDYKKMYAEALHENEKLKSRLHDSKHELVKIRSQLDKVTQRHDRISERSTVLESEKREKQALEKRVSNMEDELKVLTELKSDNQRLKDENGALIRVISKLSK